MVIKLVPKVNERSYLVQRHWRLSILEPGICPEFDEIKGLAGRTVTHQIEGVLIHIHLVADFEKRVGNPCVTDISLLEQAR